MSTNNLSERSRVNINIASFVAIILVAVGAYGAYRDIKSGVDECKAGIQFLQTKSATKVNVEDVAVYVVKKNFPHLSFDEELKIRNDLRDLIKDR